LTVLSSVAKHPVLGSNLISKTIRNDNPDAQLNTSFRVAAVKISV
jgi:hypothetical protein